MLSINLPSILTPDAGLLFWMLLAFLVVFFFVAKYGFPAIINMVDERKKYIDQALAKAHEANEKLMGIQHESQQLIKQARQEQADIIRQAQETAKGIVQQASVKAQEEGAARLKDVQQQIIAEKANALREIRQTVATLSVKIAEKVIQKELSSQEAHQAFITKLVDEALEEKDK